MGVIIEEPKNIGDLLRYEQERNFCRETIMVASGQNLKVGSVLGMVSETGKYKMVDANADDGTETAVAVLLADCDASNADAEGLIIKRNAIIVDNGMVYPVGSTEAEISQFNKELEAVGILVRRAL